MGSARLFFCTLSVLALPRAAAANGAFPDSMGLMLPSDRPNEIDLATNFGLVITHDAGVSWSWVCEGAIGTGLVSLYQIAPAPDDTIFAVGDRGLYHSNDDCAWSVAGGGLAGASPNDAFVDPTNPLRVIAIATHQTDAGTDPSSLFASVDGGVTFGDSLIDAPVGVTFSSLEIARSDPQTIYLTSSASQDQHPYLLRSSDGGKSFTTVDELSALGASTPRIAAVDPTDSQTLYLRVQGAGNDTLAISHDGGNTFAIALSPAARLTAFLRRASGTILVGDAQGDGYRSTDGGKTFSNWPIGVNLRGLGERDGHLYAAAASVGEDFQVGLSDDEGAHFTTLLRFSDLCGPLSCSQVQAACAPSWPILTAMLGITGSAGCPQPDGGFAQHDAATVITTPGNSPGCGCRVVSGSNSTGSPLASWCVLGILSLLAATRRRSRFRRAALRIQSRPCPKSRPIW